MESFHRKITYYEILFKTIKAAECKTKDLEIARRLFLASYAMKGIKLIDLIALKTACVKEIEGCAYLFYTKHKTGLFDIFPVNELLKEQLEWFKANCNLKPDQLFPVYNGDKITGEILVSRLAECRDKFKEMIKEIGIEAHVPIDAASLCYDAIQIKRMITSFQRRTSPKLMDALGHKDIETTKKYLDGFKE